MRRPQRQGAREETDKPGPFQRDDEERQDAWSRGAVPARGGSGLGRRERGPDGEAQTTWRGRKMVPLPGAGRRPRRRSGGNFAGEDGAGRGAAAPRIAAAPARGPGRGEPRTGGWGVRGKEAGAGRSRSGAGPDGQRGTDARSDRRSGDPGADGFGARSGQRLRGGGAATPPRRFQRLPPPRTLPAPHPFSQVRPPRPGLGRRSPLRTRTLGSPGATSPPPRPAHLASTGTWAIPGLGPR